MSTKNVSSTSGSQNSIYNPNSMASYNMLNPTGASAIQSEINNPYSNMFFNNQLGMMNSQLGAQNSANMSGIQQNAQAMGMAGNNPMLNYQMRQAANQNSANRAQGFNNLLMNASNLRQSAIGGAMNYQPLQTGSNFNSTNQQYKSGLGTYLPQIASMAMAPFTGGSSLLGMGGSLVGAMGASSPSVAASQAWGGNNNLTNLAGNIGNTNMPMNMAYGNTFMPGVGF